MLFATARLSHTLKASSIKVSQGCVLHVENGSGDPLENCLRLEKVIRGIKRVQGLEVRPRRPITATILRQISSLLNHNNYRYLLFWAVCCTGIFGFLRSGEFATGSSYDPKIHLSLADISVDRTINPQVLLLHIKASKTDQFRKGHTLRIESTNSSVCAVRAMTNYLHLRGNKAGPLFVHETGHPLTRKDLVACIKDATARIGLEGNYSGHSFRVGAATTAATVGIPDHLIQTMGRWLSDAYQLYIHTPTNVIEGVAVRLIYLPACTYKASNLCKL